MNLNMLIDNFDLLETPESIDELKKTILELGVRGQLVPQDPRDEAASELHEKLKKEKTNKKTKIFVPLKEEEKPYRLPLSAQWIKIGEVVDLVNGKAFKSSEWSDKGLPIIRIQNLNNSDASFNYCNFGIHDKYKIENNTLLISWSGTPGTSFGAFVWNRGPAVLNQHIFKVVFFSNIYDIKFFQYAVNSRLDEMISKAQGGVGLKHITKKKLENMCVPLYPLNEQKRIVAKVDELFAKCDQLKEKLQQTQSKSQILTQTSLERLSAISNKQQFNKNWQFLTNNFDVMIQTPQQVQELRQTILQLAVMGQLVPQDPNDVPASELLKKIQAEKQKLIAEKKIKKQKPLLPVADEEKPYELPDGWEWLRIEQFISYEKKGMMTGPFGSALHKRDHQQQGVPVWGIESIKNNKFTYKNKIFVTQEKAHTLNSFYAFPGDILISRSGTIDQICVIPNDAKNGLISTNLLKLSLNGNLVHAQYFCYLFKGCIPVLEKLKQVCRGSTRLFLNQKILRSLIFPIPPVREQINIINKVENLSIACFNLKKTMINKNLKNIVNQSFGRP